MSSGGVVLITGSRGSGKSTKARELASSYKMAVAIDPARDWQWSRGWVRADTLKEVAALIRKHWRGGKRIAYTPPVGYEAEALHHLSGMVFQAQEAFFAGSSARKFLVVVDEAAEAYGNRHQERQDLTGFKRVLNQGRHHGIDVVAITQRPQDVATRMRTNADTFYAFRLGDAAAIKAVADKIGRAEAAKVAKLPAFSYVQISDGEVKNGKTRKPR